jgi:hypothetical protein
MVDPTLTAIAIGGLGMQIAHWFAPAFPIPVNRSPTYTFS